MADKVQGAQYGESSKEEHRRSGYRYPDSFYETPKPIDVGKPTDPSQQQARKSGTKRKAGPKKNKSRTPRTSNK